ncbi:adenylate/guanylate cyclase domain-containing protein [Ilumatobacter sp.]|uniref:adenylate/guanylate cyclase domain-containing protein n=1 Tax=Ilumatobacter sp. TaxID=1967498 RepID=UPI00375282B9
MPRFRLKKVRTVREVLEALGLPPETIDEAEASGTAELLAIDAVVLPGKPKLTIDDLAAKVGVEADVVRSLWRALGFVDTDDDERSFTKHDVAILKSLVTVTQNGLVDPDMALQVSRVIGMSLANVATAVVDAGAARSVERREAAASADDGDDVAEDPSALAVRAGELLPFMSEVIDYSFRRHLRAAARRRVLLASSPGGETQVIGFADLVRFTELSLHLNDRKLADLVGRFDSLVHDVVVGNDGRIVKMIGDAAMFSVLDPAQAALIALELTNAVKRDPILSGLRIGMASGPTLARDGDLYGPVVNTASRLAAIGRAGAVNVNQSLRDELAGDRRFALRSLGQRNLRHIGEVRVYRLRPGPMGQHPSSHSEQ